MWKLLPLLSFFYLINGCSSDDERQACDTQIPIEILEGEGRISVTWQDGTADRIIDSYEYQLVFRGELPDDTYGRTTVPVTTPPENERFHIQNFKSLPFEQELDLYYRAICVNGMGETLGPIAVRTLAFGQGCTPPADFVAFDLTSTTATFSWEGFDEQLWRISWGANDGEDGGDADVTDSTFTITDLRPGVAYLVGIRALCTGTDFGQSQLDLNPTLTVTTLDE